MTLNEYVLALQEPLIAALRENLRIPSVEASPEPNAPYGTAVRRSLDHAAETARKLGFSPVDVDGHVLWCEYGEGEEMVAVLGHLDVVPAGDGWTCDPYGGELFDGKINAVAAVGEGKVRVGGMISQVDNVNRILDRVSLYLA